MTVMHVPGARMSGPSSRVVLALLLLVTIVSGQTSTAIVTETTTITATNSGACNNFIGACVVYGGDGGAPYTTMVHGSSDMSPSNTVSTTTVSVTEGAAGSTADISGVCNGFTGACVVYETAAGGGIDSTTIYDSNGDPLATGNSDGYIGPADSSEGYIGQAAGLGLGIIGPLVAWMLVNLGFFVWL